MAETVKTTLELLYPDLEVRELSPSNLFNILSESFKNKGFKFFEVINPAAGRNAKFISYPEDTTFVTAHLSITGSIHIIDMFRIVAGDRIVVALPADIIPVSHLKPQSAEGTFSGSADEIIGQISAQVQTDETVSEWLCLSAEQNQFIRLL